ncbi:MAG: ABC transporter permease, partial [Chloroflexi bacterium]|nr:ABC transporter permease [Chloroflexota bacterium]
VAVAPETATGLRIVAGSQNTFATARGVTSTWLSVRNIELAEGRPVSPADILNELQVVILGSNVFERLFESGNAISQTVRLDGRQFVVIGVMERQGGTGFGNIDDQILVPLTTAHFRLNGGRTPQGDITVNTINIQAAGPDSLEAAQAQVESLLRLRHRLSIDDEDDFTVTNQQDTIDTLESTTDTFVVFLAAVAGISLLVGGIGIMNIMLVSVTERTREIGVRRAVGAKRRDILMQFVTEATMLSAAGGLVGVALGSAVARAIDGRTFGSETFQTVLNADVAIYALGVSAAIGLFFGIYPAARAARLDPIEALRQV